MQSTASALPYLISLATQIKLGLSGIKIGLLQEGFDHCESVIEQLVRDAARMLSYAGASVTDISIPEHLHGRFSDIAVVVVIVIIVLLLLNIFV